MQCERDELRTLFLFEALTDEQLETLCTNGQIRQYQSGPICLEGEPATCFYVLIEGELAMREIRSGRVEVVPMWGRPESAREEFRRLRAQ